MSNRMSQDQDQQKQRDELEKPPIETVSLPKLNKQQQQEGGDDDAEDTVPYDPRGKSPHEGGVGIEGRTGNSDAPPEDDIGDESYDETSKHEPRPGAK